MTEDLKTMNLQLEDPNEAIALLGNSDANLKIIEQELNVSIVTRENPFMCLVKWRR